MNPVVKAVTPRIPLSSPHTHTLYVDGRNTPEETVLAALDAGFVSIGFSEHALQDFDTAYALDHERERQYIHDICALKQKYRNQIAIYLGIERDALSIADRRLFEYTIGSVHYVKKNDLRVAVDGDPEILRDFIKENLHGNAMDLAAMYYQSLADYILAFKPDIIGHFDLVSKHNRRLGLWGENSRDYLHLAFCAMEQCIRGCDLMEVNTGAMARSGALSPYPSLDLLRYWRSLGGRVILSSDCHQKQQICFGYEKGLALIREAGYKQLWYLNPQKGSLFTSTELSASLL